MSLDMSKIDSYGKLHDNCHPKWVWMTCQTIRGIDWQCQSANVMDSSGWYVKGENMSYIFEVIRSKSNRISKKLACFLFDSFIELVWFHWLLITCRPGYWLYRWCVRWHSWIGGQHADKWPMEACRWHTCSQIDMCSMIVHAWHIYICTIICIQIPHEISHSDVKSAQHLHCHP